MRGVLNALHLPATCFPRAMEFHANLETAMHMQGSPCVDRTAVIPRMLHPNNQVLSELWVYIGRYIQIDFHYYNTKKRNVFTVIFDAHYF